MKRDEINNLIDTERTRQDRLHPELPSNLAEQLNILTEEVGESAQALNNYLEWSKLGLKSDGATQTSERLMEQYKTELTQVAAVAVRLLENMK